MARRPAVAKPVEEAPVEVTEAPVEVTEAPVEVVATEAPVEADTNEDQAKADAVADEAAQAPAAPAEPKPEQVVDIEKFTSTLQAGLDTKDSATGVMDVKALSDIHTSYRGLENVKSKTAARKFVQDSMAAAVTEGDIGTARALVALSKELSSASTGSKTPKAPSAPKAPADPTLAFVSQAVRLKLAMKIHADSIVEGVRPEWKDEVNDLFERLTGELDTYATYLDSEDENAEAPEVDPLVVAAFKTAAGRAAGTKSVRQSTSVSGDGVRRNIANHITEAFAELPVGSFLSVAQLRAFKSAEYGDVPVSAGAINARLFPKDKSGTITATTVPGVEGTEDENGHKGARKTA